MSALLPHTSACFKYIKCRPRGDYFQITFYLIIKFGKDFFVIFFTL